MVHIRQAKPALYYKSFRVWLSYGLILSGGLGLSAWISGLRVLDSISANFVSVAPDTSVIFILLGVILFFTTLRPDHHLQKMFSLSILGLVSIYGLLKFVEYFAGVDLTLENVLFPVTDTLGLFILGRMSPITGFLFFLSGIALLLILSPKTYRALRNYTSGLGLAVGVAGFIATLGYLFNAPFLYGSSIIPLAATTSFAFLLLGLGILSMSEPANIFVRPLAGPSVRAILLRNFLPLVIGALLFESLVHQTLDRFYPVNEALSISIISFVFVALTGAMVFSVARSISRKLDEAQNALQQANAFSWSILEKTPYPIMVLNPDDSIRYVNPAFVKLTGFLPSEIIGTNRLLCTGLKINYSNTRWTIRTRTYPNANGFSRRRTESCFGCT